MCFKGAQGGDMANSVSDVIAGCVEEGADGDIKILLACIGDDHFNSLVTLPLMSNMAK